MLIIRTLWVWGVLGGVSLECFHGIGAGIGTTKLSEPDPQCHYISCIALFVDSRSTLDLGLATSHLAL